MQWHYHFTDEEAGLLVTSEPGLESRHSSTSLVHSLPLHYATMITFISREIKQLFFKSYY